LKMNANPTVQDEITQFLDALQKAA